MMGERKRIEGEILDCFLTSHPAHLQAPNEHRALWEEMVVDYGSQVEQMHPHTRIMFYYGGASRLAWAGDWAEAQKLFLEVERLVGKHGWDGVSQSHMLTYELGLCAYMLGRKEEAYSRWESLLGTPLVKHEVGGCIGVLAYIATGKELPTAERFRRIVSELIGMRKGRKRLAARALSAQTSDELKDILQEFRP